MNTDHSVEIEPTTSISAALPKALVLGNGIPALIAAEALTDMGVDVTFARVRYAPSYMYFSPPDASIDDELKRLPLEVCNVKLIDLERAPLVCRDHGGFKALFEDGTESFYDSLLLAPGVSLSPKPSALPEDAELFTSETEVPRAERVAFLMDYERPSDPSLGMSAIAVAAQNVVSGGKSVVCFQHVPVQHLFGETLYDEARKVGVQFIRFGDKLPVISSVGESNSPNRFQVTVKDVIDDEEEFIFDCNRVLSVTRPDASTIPGWAFEKIAKDDLDDQGVALTGSVHCNSGEAVASGVFFVGEATGSLDLVGNISHARAAAAKAQAWIRTSRLKRKNQPISISTACVGCLTCHRVCPHGAVSVEPRPCHPPIESWPSLCQECGICASLCPSVAIRFRALADDSLISCLKEIPRTDMTRTTVVFGCERSAGLLGQSIQMPEYVRFFAVPCAGRVSEYMIWSALAAGAKGVLVVGCHHGNCRSRTGTDWAAARIRRGLRTGLFQHGSPRLDYKTIAPNESTHFQRMLRELEPDR